MNTGIPWYKKLDNFIMNLEHIIIGSGMIFISFIIIINTLMRYFAHHSFAWAEELARYVVAWICFVGSASCVRFGTHAVVEIFMHYLNKKVRMIYNISMGIICVGFSVFLTNMGWAGFLSSFRLGNLSSMIGVPIWVIFLGVALGLFLIFYNYVRNTIINILDLKHLEKGVSQKPVSGEAQI